MSRIVRVLNDIFIPVPPRTNTNTNDYDNVPIYVNRLDEFDHNERLALQKTKTAVNDEEKNKIETLADQISLSDASTIVPQTQRRLQNRHVQLIGISGVIGTALFVAIGNGLQKGPAFLLLGFGVWCIPILCITVSTAEMVCYLPINSPFIRMAGRCCDDAFEFMAGWNFWFLECVQIPYEIVGANTIIHYWRDDYSPGITIGIQTFLYFLISIFAVKVYGETEFWLAIGKIILAVGLMFFTFITMLGGNPKHDRFGFRYWNDPGAFNTYWSDGSLGYFQAFVACIIQASYTIAGPDYLSMVAGETILPRSRTLPKAFKQIFYRLTFLFLGGCICVGILVGYNDPDLTAAINNSRPGAGSSPYVIAMDHLGIHVLPHVVNGALIVAAFSAGNAYTYCSSRTLYGLALDGKAPKIFSWCNKAGVPIIAVLTSLCWAFIAFLQMGENSAIVLNWLINLITSCQLINFSVMSFTFIFFHRAVEAQGLNRNEFTFKSWFQPYTAIVGLVCAFVMTWVGGYTVFIKGNWSIKNFLFSYLAIFVDIALYTFWKILKRPKWRKPKEVDLFTGLKEIEDHEREYMAEVKMKNELHPRSKISTAMSTIVGVLVGKD